MSMRSLLRDRKDMSDSEDEIIWDTSLKQKRRYEIVITSFM